jgi:predicted acetyltransferase
MRKIREINEELYDNFVRIIAGAYPGLKLVKEKDRQEFKEELIKQDKDSRISTWGLFDDSELLGGLRLYDFRMTLRGQQMLAGGGGLLAVDLLHKREHIGKELMLFFFDYYRKKDSPVAQLWAFRPDFYRSMGCGYGSKGHHYKVKPEHFPKGPTKEHIRNLGLDDLPAIADCYNRHAARVNGMIEAELVHWEYLYKRGESLRYVGVEHDGTLEGYAVYRFETIDEGGFLDNNIRIIELIYETPRALLELSSFLHSQADQVNRVVIDTTDDNFHHLLFDPRNDSNRLVHPVYHESHTSSVGVMYRVLDIVKLFGNLKTHNFGWQSCKLKLTIRDSFIPENDGSYILHVDGGRAKIVDDGLSDFEVTMDISDFSSLIMGAVDFRSIYNYSRATISDNEYVETVNRLFATDHKPICMTAF